jgi:hypothetical protein
MTSAIIFVRDFAVSVAVGTILLLLLTKLIGRVQVLLEHRYWVFIHRPRVIEHHRLPAGICLCITASGRSYHWLYTWMLRSRYTLSDTRSCNE